jgi:aryl-alcohol dehydrogenase-like predicted oxidoreductase
MLHMRSLGSLPVEVSALGLGCNTFGVIPDRDSADIVSLAMELGINFFDTADVYASGGSEEALGRHLLGRRSKVLIATKFGHPSSSKPPERPGGRAHIIAAVEGSLRRLRTHWIDLYQMHFPDPETPIKESLSALSDLIRAGKVRYIGCSNFSPLQMKESFEVAREVGLSTFATCQQPYSLLDRTIESELLPTAQSLGIGILPCFPLASGLLTGKYSKNAPATAVANSVRSKVVRGFAERFLTATNLRLAAQLDQFAGSLGWTLSNLAIAWLLTHRSVSSVIAGATQANQLKANHRALALNLEPSVLLKLDKLLHESKEVHEFKTHP